MTEKPPMTITEARAFAKHARRAFRKRRVSPFDSCVATHDVSTRCQRFPRAKASVSFGVCSFIAQYPLHYYLQVGHARNVSASP